MADAFAEKAAQWDANPVRAAAAQAFYEQVLRVVPNFAGKTALEFGCGTGELGLRLAGEHRASMLFVDNSPAMLEVLRGKIAARGLSGVQVMHGDIARLPIAEASLDTILTAMALHHVDDVPHLLRRFRQLLKPGGLLLAADLLPEDGSFHAPDPVAHNGFNPAELARVAAACGLKPQEHQPFHTLQKPDATGALREYTLFLLAAEAV